jgi:DNA polymerase-3 subunit gamma/tau
MRNLLVSRDAVTLPLLEMSEKMRSRYQEQAQRCPIHFVYKVLKLSNDCDQAYRTSRNKRLQVEICLIQSAQASEPDNSDASGHGPAQIIKPVKKEAQTQSAPQPVSVPKAEATKPVEKPSQVAQVNVPNSETKPAILPDKAQAVPDPAAPKKLTKVSFKHFGAGKKEEEAAPTSPAMEATGGSEPINSEKLTAAWFAFIDSLPHESVALAKRLKSLQPTVKDENNALLAVSNPQVQQTVESQMPQILAIMRKELRNDSFLLETQLEEMQEVVKSYSPQEMLKVLKKQNADVGELVSKLQLTFE